MLSTSVAAPGRVSQSASKNATYIEQALQTEDYAKKLLLGSHSALDFWISHLTSHAFSLWLSQVEIKVDLSFPERNRKVFVFSFSGKKHQRKLHDGFSIELVADVRDVTKGLYIASLLPNRANVFIQFAAQSASFVLDHRLVSEKEEIHACDKVQEAREIIWNAIQNSEKWKLKNIILKFPWYMGTIQRRRDQNDHCSIQTPGYDWPDLLSFIAMLACLEDSYC
jgi:hypothetical protein